MQYHQVRGIDGAIDPNIIKGVTDDGQEMWIPNDMGNADWRAYQAWLEEGNKPEPPPELPVVPTPPIGEITVEERIASLEHVTTDLSTRVADLEETVEGANR